LTKINQAVKDWSLINQALKDWSLCIRVLLCWIGLVIFNIYYSLNFDAQEFDLFYLSDKIDLRLFIEEVLFH